MSHPALLSSGSNQILTLYPPGVSPLPSSTPPSVCNVASWAAIQSHEQSCKSLSWALLLGTYWKHEDTDNFFWNMLDGDHAGPPPQHRFCFHPPTHPDACWSSHCTGIMGFMLHSESHYATVCVCDTCGETGALHIQYFLSSLYLYSWSWTLRSEPVYL